MTTLTIPGEPIPKGRPRFSVICGKVHAFTPERTRAAEEAMGWQLRSAHSGPPMTGDIGVSVAFYCKSKTADADNLLKLLMDSAQGIIFENDKQVTRIHVTVHRGSTDPHTVVQFAEVGESRAAA
jgi:Holliday junction resolvase RusA-like endonuclease